MDYIQTSAVDKMAKFLDKGLDPNYQDSDTGGKVPSTPPTAHEHLVILSTQSKFSLVTWITFNSCHAAQFKKVFHKIKQTHL